MMHKTNNKNWISQISDFSFHDEELESLIFNVSQKTLCLIISQYSEKKKKHTSISLLFEQISDYKTNIDNFFIHEIFDIYSLDIEELLKSKFSCEIELLTGPGKPSLNIQFKFQNCIIKNSMA